MPRFLLILLKATLLQTNFTIPVFTHKMPFTFSHPAIVLPLAFLPKRWFSLTGLVIGSMTPDFEYFLRMNVQGEYGHTISGLFWFDLPLGILVTFLFHNSIRNPLFNNLPTFVTSRLVSFKQFDWNRYFNKNWIAVIFSILIGASSHLFWDSFTHLDGYFVEVIPALTNTITLFGKQIPLFKILQHSSTFLGGLIIMIALYKLPVHEGVVKHFNRYYWGILAALTLTIIIVRASIGLETNQFGNLIVTSISATLIALSITPWIIRQKK